MLLAEALAKASALFASAGIETPEIDAQLLAAHVLGSSRGSIQSDLIIGRELTETELQEFEALTAKRAELYREVDGLALVEAPALEEGFGRPAPIGAATTGFFAAARNSP